MSWKKHVCVVPPSNRKFTSWVEFTEPLPEISDDERTKHQEEMLNDALVVYLEARYYPPKTFNDAVELIERQANRLRPLMERNITAYTGMKLLEEFVRGEVTIAECIHANWGL